MTNVRSALKRAVLSVGVAAAIVGGTVYLIGAIASFWLPEPTQEMLPE